MPGQLRPHRSGAIQQRGIRPGPQHGPFVGRVAGEFLPVPDRLPRVQPARAVDLHRLAGLQQGRQTRRKCRCSRMAGAFHRPVAVHSLRDRPGALTRLSPGWLDARRRWWSHWCADCDSPAGNDRRPGFDPVSVGHGAGRFDPVCRDILVPGDGRSWQVHADRPDLDGRHDSRHAGLVCRTPRQGQAGGSPQSGFSAAEK